MDNKAMLLGNFLLLCFDALINKLGHAPTFNAHHVIVVRFIIQLKDCACTFEFIADNEPGIFKLGQYTVDRRQPDVLLLLEKNFIDIFR